MSVSYHNSWDQYGFNMALIWLRYGFLENHMEILPKLYGNMLACLGEIFETVLPVIRKNSEGQLG